MEEKNAPKNSLSTLFFIFSILVIIVMGIVIFKLYNEKNEEANKSAELQAQVNNLNGTVTNLQEKIETINNSTEKKTNESSIAETSTSQPSKSETSKTDYSKYFGTWTDGENEFTVRNIGNDLITFTWFIYRTASIDDVTLPFKDNKAVFYYHGYDDKNFNSKNEDDEFYCRKATVELKKNSISIKVENSTLEESNKNMSLDKTDLFGGGVYIEPGQYNFTTKK